MNLYQKTCPICEASFETATKHQIYCSPSCARVRARTAAKRNYQENRESNPGGQNLNSVTPLTHYLCHCYHYDGESPEEIAATLCRPVSVVLDLLDKPLPEWKQDCLTKWRTPSKRR